MTDEQRIALQMIRRPADRHLETRRFMLWSEALERKCALAQERQRRLAAARSAILLLTAALCGGLLIGATVALFGAP